ncbi:unnamed protein product [Closterium sp. NIES-64]|nr:unnamed protein product [Closterium sp. NIES-64]
MEVLEREGHSGPPLVDHLPIPETEELLLHPPPDFHASHDGAFSPYSVRSPRSPQLQPHSSPPARRARGSRGQYSEISEEDYSEDEDNDGDSLLDPSGKRGKRRRPFDLDLDRPLGPSSLPYPFSLLSSYSSSSLASLCSDAIWLRWPVIAAVAVIILVIIFLTSPAAVSPTTTTPPSDGSDSFYPSDLDGTGTGSSREPRGYHPLPVDSFKGVDASTLDPSTLPSGGRGAGGGDWGTGAGGNWGGGKPGEDPQEGLYPDAKPARGGGRWGKAGAGAGAGGGGHLGEEAAEVEDYRDSAGVGREGEVVGEDAKKKRSRLDDEVVTWRGAPWRFDVGDWLSSCNGESGVIKTVEVGAGGNKEGGGTGGRGGCGRRASRGGKQGEEWDWVKVLEEVYGNKCMQDCNGVGTCHYDTGRCRCRIGYTGADCSHMDAHPCSSPPTSSAGVVGGSAWACAGECDLHSGLCFCGAASLFPLRPVPDPCGFAHDLAAAVDRTRKDTEALYANTTHYPGWCNTRPEAVGVGMGGSMAMGGAEPRARCTCDYDGAVGAFCHVPVAAFCVNQCSGHGTCIRGHCQCNEGWFSVDCSVPSQATFADPQLPAWLQPFDQAKRQGALGGGGTGDFVEWDVPVADRGPHDSHERRWLRGRQDEEDGEGEGETEEDAEGGGYGGEGAADGGRNAAGDRAGAGGAGGAAGGAVGAGGRNEVVKRRPLIYIYDLPPQFNSNLLQGRRGKKECVPRLYDRLNRTAFLPDHIHGMEIALHEALLASKHRTTNAEEADFFFVPVYASCFWLRLTNGGDASGIQLLPHVQGSWAWHVAEMYSAVHRHIVHAYPHWNRSRGRDHLWPMGTDEGACLAPQAIWHGSMLTSWGNSMAAHSHSVKAAPQQRWDDIPLTLRGGHLCYSAAKDIVLPAWLPPNVKHLHEQYWLRSFEEREHLFYFAGDLGSEYKGGSPDTRFSFGIRQAVAREFASVPNNKGQLGSQQEEGVIVTNERGKGHSAQLGNARFCGVFPSNGFNADMEEAMKHGCIPVIIQVHPSAARLPLNKAILSVTPDGIHLPFENALEYASFSVRIEERDIPNMLTKLKAITAEHGSALQGTVQKVWQRLSYHSVIAQEAKRQQDEYGHNEAWAFGISLLKDDDAIDTLIEVYPTGDIMANAAPLNPSAAAMAAAQAIVALRKVSKAAANANLKVPENAATDEARACEVELSHFRGMDDRELNLTLHVTSLTPAAVLAMQRAKEISKVLTSKASLHDPLQKSRYENVNTDDRKKPDSHPRLGLSFRDRSGRSDFGTAQGRRKGSGRSENFLAMANLSNHNVQLWKQG